MIEISVTAPGQATWRRSYVTGTVHVGRGAGHELQLEHTLAEPSLFHLTRLDNSGIVMLVPLAEELRVDGASVDLSHRLTEDNRIEVAGYVFAARNRMPARLGDATVEIRGADEQRLIDAIVAGDGASRLVYADWLEGRGEQARAEWLRLEHAAAQLAPADPRIDALTDRLREVAAATDVAWRSRLSHGAIEGCPQFEFACPKQWSALSPTDEEGVRHCSACDQRVHYSASVEEAREHAAAGRCVALDVTSARWPRDLDAPFGRHRCHKCEVDVGPGLDVCPHCGAFVGRMMTRGKIRVTR